MQLHYRLPNILKFILNISLIKSMYLSQFYVEAVDLNTTDPVPRVVSGKQATLGEVPYQVAFKSIYSRQRNMYITFCGGVIITRTKLLSAAHCFNVKKTAICSESVRVKGRFLTGKYAVAGNLLNAAVYKKGGSGQGQWRKLRQVIYPAKYAFPKYDIAVVIISAPFVFNDAVAPIPFATRFKDYPGECLASGYGRTSSAFAKKKETAVYLMVAHLSIVQANTCSRRHRRNMKHFVCTSDRVSDVSQGDSGGPLVCYNTGDPKEGSNGIVVGIVSGNRRGAGSFFTRVSSYYKYIQRNNAQCTPLSYYSCVLLLVIYGLYLF